ncbi:transcription factor GAMYB-like [Nicotiana tabacum]|uniref:Anther-specific myb-related protein 2 n=1 Tax=Nicotiana tabacum TaxID=4097 RepID=Q9FR43_TOBAC|nr:transcription factor GAMYB-like [Nicotiana tabacum]AAG28525.1 anther-specific myb-related protein 2 [Nicotiana tabacum]
MAPDGGGLKARNNGGTRQVLKKGPWTAAEDAILMEYVKKNGEGNWNAVQRNSGLMRCGKSCRLRWANHLRPNLKKGAFSLEEERFIVELHAKLGNKWARMAAQMPGRTDNEIKNYWNTRLKRRQRAGLPIYPQDIQPQLNQQNISIPSPFDNNPQNSNYINNPPLSLLDIFNPSTMKPSNISNQYQSNNNPSPYLTNNNNNNQFKFFRDPRVRLSLTLASSIRNSQHSSMVAPVPNNFNQSYSNSMPVPPLQHNYPNFGSTTRPFTGIPSNPNGLILGMGVQNNPSVQSSMPETKTCSRNTGSDFMNTTSSDGADNYDINPGLSRGNSGLLEDLLEESQALTRVEKIEENCPIENEAIKGKLVWEEYGLSEEAEDIILTEESTFSFAQEGGDNATPNKHSEDSSSLNSSSGITTKEGSLELANQVDEDIMRFLDNFPVGVPVPDWCNDENDEQNTSNGQSFECDQIQSHCSKSG